MSTENNLMREDVADDRWRQIRRIWAAKENQWLYALVGFFAGLLIVSFLGTQTDILGNLFPEALGILFTVLVIDQLNERRAERLRKEELILQMGSPNNEFAIEAVRILRLKGWLMDGSLRREDFRSSNLYGANLSGADLQNAHLQGATLQRVHLDFANLQGANLEVANLQGAWLIECNLRRAILPNLMQNTILTGADLQGAFIEHAQFDINTFLPDGMKWTSNTDMTRFTDPHHPQFWRSNNPTSPAYSGNKA